jgi:histidinol-phosphate aminotransferase
MVVQMRAGLAAAAAYVPGKQPKMDQDAARLAANENPLPPLQSVQRAIREGIAGLNRYPEAVGTTLRTAIADHHGLSADMVTIGAGAGSLCERAVIATCGTDNNLIFGQPSFIGYANYAATAGAEAVRVPLDDSLTYDLDAIADRVDGKTGAIIVCNPNNPTGTGVGLDRLRRFLDAVPDRCLVLLDEAYIDFADAPDCVPGAELIADYENLLVVHTFSKAYGLAGIRAGYALAQPSTIATVNMARSPFQINNLGHIAALASLAATAELTERIETVKAERRWLVEQLGQLGIATPASHGNFLWVPMTGERAASTAAALEQAGVLVRPLRSGVRITIGTHQENERLVRGLAALAGGSGHVGD